MNKIICTLLFSLASLFSIAQSTTVYDSSSVRYAETISASDLSKHLHILASDEYEGRETGKKGQKMAANYIASIFEQNNLKPVGDYQTYFQKFEMTNYKYKEISISNQVMKFTEWEDYVYLHRNLEYIDLQNTEVVYLGNGNEENYKTINIKDKIALIFSKNGLEEEGLMRIAYDKGAKFVFFVSKGVKKYSISNEYKHYIERDEMIFNDIKLEKKNPSISISYPMAVSILSVSKSKLDKLNKGKFDASRIIKSNIDFKIELEKTIIKTENVCGLVESNTNSNEYIVLTAHYDHIGMEGEVVFNGADDDGSGTVTLLEMAQAFSKAKVEGVSPKRNILFVAMTGEEKGLLGSEYYSNHPIFPLEKTVANLNTDMIGRVDEFHKDDSNYVYLIGTDMISKELHQVSEQVAALYSDLKLDYRFNTLDDPNQFYYRSDHYNFAKKGIPVIFYFSGVHEDYHKSTDTVDKIMFGKTEKIARLIFYTAWELANRTTRLTID